MKRIRFIKSDDGKFLYTSQPCMIKNKLLFAKIKLSTMTAHIRDINSPREDIVQFNADKLDNLKKQVKIWFINNGVFTKEKRTYNKNRKRI